MCRGCLWLLPHLDGRAGWSEQVKLVCIYDFYFCSSFFAALLLTYQSGLKSPCKAAGSDGEDG